jgi:hypothetical protein
MRRPPGQASAAEEPQQGASPPRAEAPDRTACVINELARRAPRQATMATEKSCCCSPTLVQIGTVVEAPPPRASLARYLVGLAGGLLAWFLVYVQLPAFASWLTYGVLRLPHGTALTEAVAFFI